MQPFEFSNNTVSLLISVFSVIVGMTYPILLQAIQRIDEQYRSSRLSDERTEIQTLSMVGCYLYSVCFCFYFCNADGRWTQCLGFGLGLSTFYSYINVAGSHVIISVFDNDVL